MPNREPVYIISPLGDIEYAEGKVTVQADHELLAEELCHFATKAGFAPFAPHLLYTRFLNDHVPSEREAGLECGRAIMALFKRAFVFTRQHPEKFSRGMKGDIETAKSLGLIIEYDPPCFDKVNPIPAYPARLPPHL